MAKSTSMRWAEDRAAGRPGVLEPATLAALEVYAVNIAFELEEGDPGVEGGVSSSRWIPRSSTGKAEIRVYALVRFSTGMFELWRVRDPEIPHLIKSLTMTSSGGVVYGSPVNVLPPSGFWGKGGMGFAHEGAARKAMKRALADECGVKDSGWGQVYDGLLNLARLDAGGAESSPLSADKSAKRAALGGSRFADDDDDYARRRATRKGVIGTAPAVEHDLAGRGEALLRLYHASGAEPVGYGELVQAELGGFQGAVFRDTAHWTEVVVHASLAKTVSDWFLVGEGGAVGRKVGRSETLFQEEGS